MSEASTISSGLGPAWLCFLPLAFFAAPVPVLAELTKLALKPQVCALTEDEELCREQIDIEWRSGERVQVCLYLGGQQTPLACWRERHGGDYRYQAHTKDNLTFELRRQPDEQLLAREMLSVIREHTDYRFRRRKPWSFF